MYSLVQDETECKSLLGTMVYLERKVYGFSVKITQVLMPESRFFGHASYFLEIKASPHNAIDNEPRIFTMCTRFKEVSHLHSTLGTIHRQLFLKDKFPTFAEAKFFGTSDPETIAERRSSIENFLNFVFNNETLCKSKAFQAFIEGTKEELKPAEEGTSRMPEENADQLEHFLLADKNAQPTVVAPDRPSSTTDEFLTMDIMAEEKKDEKEKTELKKA